MTRIIRYKDSEPSTPPNYAMFFDGDLQRLELGDPDVIVGAMSITGWFNSSILANDGSIVGIADGEGFSPWRVYLNEFNGGLSFWLIDSTGRPNNYISERTGLNDDEWHHFAIVFNNGATRLSIQIYVDGELDRLFQGGNGIFEPIGTMPLVIGMLGPSPGLLPFNGLLDDIVVFDGVVLDALQVSQIYAGRARINMLPFLPKYWWKMGDDAIFDGENWIVPDAVGAGDMVSENMDFSNRQPGVPEL